MATENCAFLANEEFAVRTWACPPRRAVGVVGLGRAVSNWVGTITAKSLAPAPGKGERPEINLALAPRRDPEPDRRTDRFARPRRTHVIPHALVAAWLACRAVLAEQTLHRELRKRRETRLGDPLVGVNLVTHRCPRRITSRSGLQIAVQSTRLDPIDDGLTVDPEPPRRFRLRGALIQIVLQQHSRLPSLHARIDRPLLEKPIERPAASSSTGQDCEIFVRHKWEICYCRQKRHFRAAFLTRNSGNWLASPSWG